MLLKHRRFDSEPPKDELLCITGPIIDILGFGPTVAEGLL